MNPILLAIAMLSGTNLNVTGSKPLVDPSAVKMPIIINVGAITEDAAKAFVAQMDVAQITGQTVIPVYISSYGGSVYALIEMIDAIKRSKVPVATIAVGKAMSAGAVLLAMGANGMRFAAPNATIMIHEVSGGAGGKVGDMEGDVAEAARLNALMFKLMAENIGKPPDFFTKLIKSKARVDWFLTAEEAIGLGLIDKIGTPDLNVKINVQTVLE